MAYEELAKQLRELPHLLFVQLHGHEDVVYKAADAIEELSRAASVWAKRAMTWAAEAEKAEKAHRWIPVTERLPDIGSNCLISPVSGCVAEGQFDGDGWTQYRWSAKLDKNTVTYWMPLPEPPKEEE